VRLDAAAKAVVLAAAGEPNPNIRFGMPAPAKADPETSREAFLIARAQYTLSYNAKTRTPKCACWRLLEVDIGNAAPCNLRAAATPEEREQIIVGLH
jgi:hypothetical protein